MKRNGITRLVFVFNCFVIKIPNGSYEHGHFLSGCIANWNERKYWKQFKNTDCDYRNKIVPSYFCSWFGLVQIQAKAAILKTDAYLNDEELEYFKNVTTDIKPDNFGYYNNRLVCVDYG